jgi:hypothetical protein
MRRDDRHFAGRPHRKENVNDNRLLTRQPARELPRVIESGANVMLKRPMAAAVTLTLLFWGAMVSLEAVGLLFRAGVPDPQQRIDAFVARLEAELSPADLPTEPVELPHQVAETDVPGHDAEHAVAAEPVREEEGTGGRLAVAFSSPLPSPEPETAAQPGETLEPSSSESSPELQESASAPVPLATVQASSPVPEAAPPARRASGTRRATSTRGPVGYAAFGWPVLDWLSL